MTLAVTVEGRGPALVLLHGWALHSGVWGDATTGVRVRLAQRYTLHLIDLPGHGRNAGVAPASDVGGLAAQVLAAAPPRAHWLGWSLGGVVALAAALAAPQRIAKLVLTASTPRFVQAPGWPQAQTEAAVARFEARLRSDHHGVVRDFLALQVLGDERAQATLHELKARVLDGGGPAPAALAAGLAVLRATDLRSAAPALAVPLLGISGTMDRLTPAAALEWLCRTVPDGRHLALARSAHAPFLSHPDDFRLAVEGFLGDAPVAERAA
jgi:pimeloyl-[acyl-carrier protein] methyl ester esterase